MNLIQLFSQLLGSGKSQVNTPSLTNDGKLDDAFSKLLTEKGFDKKDIAKITQLLESQKNERKAFVNKAGIEVSIEYPIHLINKQNPQFNGLKEQIAKLPNASDIQETGKPLDLPTKELSVKSPTNVVVPQQETIASINAKFHILAENRTADKKAGLLADKTAPIAINQGEKNQILDKTKNTAANGLVNSQLNTGLNNSLLATNFNDKEAGKAPTLATPQTAQAPQDDKTKQFEVKTPQAESKSNGIDTKVSASQTANLIKIVDKSDVSHNAKVDAKSGQLIQENLSKTAAKIPTGNEAASESSNTIAASSGIDKIEKERSIKADTAQVKQAEQKGIEINSALAVEGAQKPLATKVEPTVIEQAKAATATLTIAAPNNLFQVAVETSAKEKSSAKKSSSATQSAPQTYLAKDGQSAGKLNIGQTINQAPAVKVDAATQNAARTAEQPQQSSAKNQSVGHIQQSQQAEQLVDKTQLKASAKLDDSTNKKQESSPKIQDFSQVKPDKNQTGKEQTETAANALAASKSTTNKHNNGLDSQELAKNTYQVNRSKIDSGSQQLAGEKVFKNSGDASNLAQPKVRFISSEKVINPQQSPQKMGAIASENNSTTTVPTKNSPIEQAEASKAPKQNTIWNESSWKVDSKKQAISAAKPSADLAVSMSEEAKKPANAQPIPISDLEQQSSKTVKGTQDLQLGEKTVIGKQAISKEEPLSNQIAKTDAIKTASAKIESTAAVNWETNWTKEASPETKTTTFNTNQGRETNQVSDSTQAKISLKEANSSASQTASTTTNSATDVARKATIQDTNLAPRLDSAVIKEKLDSAATQSFINRDERINTAEKVSNTTDLNVVDKKMEKTAETKVQALNTAEKITSAKVEQQSVKEEFIRADAKKNDVKQQSSISANQSQQVEIKQELSQIKNDRQNAINSNDFDNRITSQQRRNDADFQQMNQQKQQSNKEFNSQLNKIAQNGVSKDKSASVMPDFSLQADATKGDISSVLSMANVNSSVKMGKDLNVQKVQETIVNQLRYTENTDWNKQRIVMDDGSSLRFNIRKVGETLQLQLIGPQSELNKMVQLNAGDIKAHLEQQLGVKVDIQFSQSDGNDKQSNQKNDSQNLSGSMGGNANGSTNGQNLSNKNDSANSAENAGLNEGTDSASTEQLASDKENPIDGWVG